MNNPSKETKAILKLTKDTIDNNVDWSLGSKRQIILGGAEQIIDNVYLAEYHGKLMRLYHYRDKRYSDDLEFFWVDGFRLEIADTSGNSLWEFPSDQATYGLYCIVREKTSNIKEFLDGILEGE